MTFIIINYREKCNINVNCEHISFYEIMISVSLNLVESFLIIKT